MISALILAAGTSTRMGQPKMLLPWGKLTVIEHVVTTFINAGVAQILIVTGGAHEQVEKALERYPVQKTFNRKYAAGEMLSSIQWGLRELPPGIQATLIGLGDQPQVQEESIRSIYGAYEKSNA